jgi:hypothetical protein
MAVASGRWAVILKETGEVIDIKLMDGTEPEINQDQVERYEVEEVDGGVMIGMVRGGKGEAVGGFGFPEEGGIGDRYGTGVTRLADVNTPERGVDPSTSHAKQRGTDTNAKESSDADPGSASQPAKNTRPARKAA